MMEIIVNSDVLLKNQIEIIEKEYKARFICDTCLYKDGLWINRPIALFYTNEPDSSKYSNWFAMYWELSRYDGDTTLMITSGEPAVKPYDEFTGLVVGDSVIYSTYRHDFRTFGDAWIDGGRDYTRSSTGLNVTIKITPFGLKLVEPKTHIWRG